TCERERTPKGGVQAVTAHEELDLALAIVQSQKQGTRYLPEQRELLQAIAREMVRQRHPSVEYPRLCSSPTGESGLSYVDLGPWPGEGEQGRRTGVVMEFYRGENPNYKTWQLTRGPTALATEVTDVFAELRREQRARGGAQSAPAEWPPKYIFETHGLQM